jgi:hypothetical protein
MLFLIVVRILGGGVNGYATTNGYGMSNGYANISSHSHKLASDAGAAPKKHLLVFSANNSTSLQRTLIEYQQYIQAPLRSSIYPRCAPLPLPTPRFLRHRCFRSV